MLTPGISTLDLVRENINIIRPLRDQIVSLDNALQQVICVNDAFTKAQDRLRESRYWVNDALFDLLQQEQALLTQGRKP